MEATVDIGTLITRTPGTCGGRPRIAGTRITVRDVINSLSGGRSPEEIVGQYEYLSLTQVYAALAYYHANKSEMDAAFAAEQAEDERIEREYLAKRRQ